MSPEGASGRKITEGTGDKARAYHLLPRPSWTLCMKFGLGQPAPRVEDRRFLTGHGRYTDDHNLAGQVRAVVVRSPYPHARIIAIDKHAAMCSPGVIAVLDHADLAADGINPIPSLGPRLVPLTRPDGSPLYEPEYPALAGDVARHRARGLQLDQRHDLHSRQPQGLRSLGRAGQSGLELSGTHQGSRPMTNRSPSD